MSRTLAALAVPGKSAWAALAALCASLFLVVAPVAAGTLSEQDLAVYKQAFKAAGDDRHDDALRIATPAKDRLPAKIIRWMKLQAPMGGTFQEIAAFMRENPDWPGQIALRRAAEAAMGESGIGADQVMAWFKANPPLTNDAFMRYADTLLLNGERERALSQIRQRWVDTNFNSGEEQDFLFRYRDQLRRQDHVARADRLLWDHQDVAAKRMLPLLDDGWDALIEARTALYQEARTVDAALARVPESLRDDPGLLYERLRYRRKRNDDGALDILRNQPAKLGRPALWWTERHILARRAMERQEYKLAYTLVRAHGLTDGASFAEAEFLAGFLALRFLDMPAEAAGHFGKLYRSVTAPISRARGAYWSGRAAEALGRADEAREWYRKAAPYGTTFYGQLAAHKLDSHAQVHLPSEPKVDQSEASAFERREVVRAARALYEIEGRDSERLAAFLRRISLQSKQPEDFALAARLAREMHRPDLAVAAAKDAAQNAVYLVEAGYPVIRTESGGNPEPALVHALIRQESTFNPAIVSSAGARGLMQLMPGTAQLVANKLGIKKHQHAKLTTDPQYNIRLGSAYISDMIERYGGSYMLAVASYNAGPSRVSQWINTYGDPRGTGIDAVDWVELIPIYETRNYVQRVMEGLLVYRARLHGGRAELNLERELRR